MALSASAAQGRLEDRLRGVARILLVGAAHPSLQVIADALAARGHTVQAVSELTAGIRLVRTRAPALILLGATGTATDCLEAMRALRQAATSPIMAIAQCAASTADYLVLHLHAKSHELEVLSLPQLTQRIELASRDLDLGEPGLTELQVLGSLRINRRARQVHVGAEELRLSAREFDLLSFLAANINRVHSPEMLLERVWRHTPSHRREVKTVAVHIRWLREKLAGQDEVRIVTVRGTGYRLDRTP